MARRFRVLFTLLVFGGALAWLLFFMASLAWDRIDLTVAIGLSPFAAGFGLLIGTVLG
ncbi:MAG: hypothetical protein GF403_10010 [Candidatus Coatesbacteria bacterium]|nr:hypothetical protein [Candidatus Coatesbacteria bacterium]